MINTFCTCIKPVEITRINIHNYCSNNKTQLESQWKQNKKTGLWALVGNMAIGNQKWGVNVASLQTPEKSGSEVRRQ